jgi:hypothetical protein
MSGKHREYTTELSHHHEGKLGDKHVDLYHLGKGGEKVGETKYISNLNILKWAEKKQKANKKREADKKRK